MRELGSPADSLEHPLTLGSGSTLSYDYLVIAPGPRLAFEEVPGLGPAGFSQSVCTPEHAEQAWAKYQEFVASPGRCRTQAERRFASGGVAAAGAGCLAAA